MDGFSYMGIYGKTGKSLDDLIQEVYDLVGEFAFERIDLNLEKLKKMKL